MSEDAVNHVCAKCKKFISGELFMLDIYDKDNNKTSYDLCFDCREKYQDVKRKWLGLKE